MLLSYGDKLCDVLLACTDAAAARGAERDNGLIRKVIAFKEGVYDTWLLSPPYRIAEEYGVVAVDRINRICYLRADGPVSLLAFAASVTSTFAYWSNSPRRIRMVNLVCASPCWLIYDVIVHSLGGIFSESITIVSILVSFIRFGWKGLERDKA